MRYIALYDHTPDPKWLAKAQKLLIQLDEAENESKRKEIIDDNSQVWGELKDWLLSLSHQKCWFSEAKDCFSHWDVEHYRPKKSAKDANGAECSGYWWLAFDWRNLRICGNAGNRKKGTFFPLRTGCQRAGRHSDLRLEVPMLLDPTDPDDPNLISFNVEGTPIAVAGCSGWDKERVCYSVERYRLDFPPLSDKRKVVWNHCWNRIQQYLQEIESTVTGDNPIARQMAKEKAKEIRSMLKEDAELSAVARACVLSTGDPRVMNLVGTT